MNTVLSVMVVVLATPVVVYSNPRPPIKTIEVLSDADEAIGSAHTELAADLQETSQEEAKKLPAETLQERISRISLGSFSKPPQNQPIEVSLANIYPILSNELVVAEGYDSKGETNPDGKEENHLVIPISDDISSVLTQTIPSDVFDSWWRKSHDENMDKSGDRLQQVNLQIPPKTIQENTQVTMLSKEQPPISGPAYPSSNVLGKDVSSNTIRSSKQESIAAPALDDLTGPYEKSVAAEVDNVRSDDAFFSNILSQKAIEASVQGSAANLKLVSLSSLAPERLLPSKDGLKTAHDIIRPSEPRFPLGLIKEPEDKPVQTILNLWESDEDDKRSSDEYEEDRSAKKEDDEDSSYVKTRF